MNRHQRRVAGRAAHRIPDDIKRDIGGVVRSMKCPFPKGIGNCLPRTLTGCFPLSALGIPATLKLGAMSYRVGPDPQRDCVTFCAPDSLGVKFSGRSLQGHFYIRSRNELVDFSVGDWMQDGAVIAPAMQWDVTPPDVFWADVSRFIRNPNNATPSVGRAWYASVTDSMHCADVELMIARAAAILKDDAFPHIQSCIERFKLRERLREAAG